MCGHSGEDSIGVKNLGTRGFLLGSSGQVTSLPSSLPTPPLPFLSFLSFLCARDGTQTLAHARQVLYTELHPRPMPNGDFNRTYFMAVIKSKQLCGHLCYDYCCQNIL